MFPNEDIYENSPKYAYRNRLLDMWFDFINISKEFKRRILSGEIDIEIATDYLSYLITLWSELAPRAKGNASLDENSSKLIEQVEQVIKNPELIYNDEYMDRVFELEQLLRKVVYDLRLFE